MFKLLIIGGIIYFVYAKIWRVPILPGKSSPFLKSKPAPKTDEQIEDTNFTEIK
ncbi:MAG: hypothetical protein ABIR66_07575 [Saprospiraceae bacterium]